MRGRSHYIHLPQWPRGPEDGPEMSWRDANDPEGPTTGDDEQEPEETEDEEE